jgi:DNA polymerase-3 subunit epsilon
MLGEDIMNFVAIDFETANADRSSVCSMGIVTVKDGKVANKNSWLIRPKELYFDPYNTFIHGITEEDVADKPEFNELWDSIKIYLEGNIVIAHNASFDISVLRYVLDAYEITYPEFNYCCTRIISKKAWPELSSFRLNVVSKHLQIKFKHHDAEEDAYASAQIAIHACNQHGAKSLHDLSNVLKFINGRLYSDGNSPARENIKSRSKLNVKDITATTDQFDEDHPFFGRHFVFTGTLQSMIRKDAIQKVVDLGGICSQGINKSTNYLVIGDLDFSLFTDGKRSSKMKKAEELLSKGQDIEILSEIDFLRLM